MSDIDFSYYHPINEKQEQFHKSSARHKLLIGGYSGGKTYPAMHESIFHALRNNGHEFLVSRNTWDTLEDNVMRDMISMAERTGAMLEFQRTKKNLVLRNNCTIYFRPLTLQRKDFKGMHLCGFFLDDPNVDRFQDTISFLYSRHRNPEDPSVKADKFISIITANWEGRNWLWQKFMNEKEEGKEHNGFAYWLVRTTDNSTLGEHYLETLKEIHSEAWMDRYVYMKNLESFSGLVYPELERNIHHTDCSHCRGKANDLLKIMAVDVGFDVTAVLKIATDGKNIWVYDEWMQRGITSNILGQYLSEEWGKDYYRAIVIDPTSAKSEQTSGRSVKKDLISTFGLRIVSGNNDVKYGIHTVKDMLRTATGKIVLKFDFTRAINLYSEFGIYRWKEPRDSDFDEMIFSETVVKRRDHLLDALRYGCVFLKPHIRDWGTNEQIFQNRMKLWDDRLTKLPLYKKNPELKNFHIRKMNILTRKRKSII